MGCARRCVRVSERPLLHLVGNAEPDNPAGPEGSGKVEQVFDDWFKAQGLARARPVRRPLGRRRASAARRGLMRHVGTDSVASLAPGGHDVADAAVGEADVQIAVGADPRVVVAGQPAQVAAAAVVWIAK